MDMIGIHGITAECIIGELAWEREQPQTIRCEIELGANLQTAGASDRLADTINYVAVGEATQQCIRSSRCQMIEALAETIAAMILDRFHPQHVAVTLWKKAHFPSATDVSVRIVRSC